MSDPTTTNYGWSKPVANADADTWGTTLNADLDSIDSDLKAVSDVADGAATSASGALAKTANLSDLVSASSARTNLGLGSAATFDLTASGAKAVGLYGTVSAGNVAEFGNSDGTVQDSGVLSTNIMLNSTNLADLDDASAARTNLGLGTLATSSNTSALNAGTNALGARTVSTSSPSGTPADGDIWVQYTP